MTFETDPADGIRERGLFAGTRLAYRQPVTRIAFPRELLDRPLPSALPPPRDDEALRRAAAPATDFAGSVRHVMWSLCGADGRPRMEPTATALGMSARTLQRRLAESGLSFGRLVQTDRQRLAAHCLERTDARVLDIALDLGYSDHAHFTRAFRRWTGLTPLAFRRAVGARRRRAVSVS